MAWDLDALETAFIDAGIDERTLKTHIWADPESGQAMMTDSLAAVLRLTMEQVLENAPEAFEGDEQGARELLQLLTAQLDRSSLGEQPPPPHHPT